MKFYLFALVLSFVFIGGCNQGIPVETVLGTVTVDGKPEVNVTVSFCPKDGKTRPAIGSTDENGTFEMITGGAKQNGVMPGEYTITFAKTILATPDGKEYVWKDNKSNSGAEAAPPLTKKYLIPKEYGDVKKSGIEAIVKKGERNEYRFDLKSRWE